MNPHPPRTKGPGLALFFLVLFLGAIVLGPLLYFALHLFKPIPFHRAMDRALLISAVAALGLFAGRVSLRRLWPWNAEVWKPVLLGYALGLVSAQAMIGMDLAVNGFTSSQLSGGKAVERILMALVAALLIPPLEETIFRGFLQTELMRGLGARAGWLLAAFVFMLAHFLKIPPELDHQPVHLWSGANALGAALLPVSQGAFLSAKGINLFLIGLILGGIFWRTGTLWVNAGLHSAWILVLLLFSGFTRPLPQPSPSFWAGDLLSTPLTTVVLILLGLWIWRFYPPPLSAPSADGANAP